jgi:hypothetical protein
MEYRSVEEAIIKINKMKEEARAKKDQVTEENK